MWYDDLNAPLGQDRVRVRQSRGRAIILAALLGGGGLIATFAPSLLEQIRSPAAAASNDANISRLAGTVSQKSVPSADMGRIPLLSDLQEESDARRPLHLPSASEPDGHATTGTEAIIEKQTGVKIVRAVEALPRHSSSTSRKHLALAVPRQPIPGLSDSRATVLSHVSQLMALDLPRFIPAPHLPHGESRIRHALRWL